MNLIDRIKGIILKPKDEWVKIKAESTPVMTLFMKVVIPLAAIPAVAQFIGYGLIGIRVPFVGMYRIPIGTSLFRAIVSYALNVAAVYVAGLVINALATTFASKQNQENAMKLVVYSLIPGWIGGVFNLLPALGFLAVIASLYGLYILYLGFQTPMMDTPQDKIVAYLIVSIVIVAVLVAVVSFVVGAIFTVGAVTMGAVPGL
jgi:hypothetical protein